ncbi:glycosyltransferase [Paenibacillus brevis]|uniref:Glycosyltransferase n=1 Tax=Paenibacillus brevis TaxID=2841508 RepID=A0ABS6FLY1_9BACL|nr:glycosyltransferase [Paenibacillus brevis]MBU5670961.1 glycosyltransferase [Paenibacillus brevis]
MPSSLIQQVIDMVKQGNIEDGYEICFSELTSNHDNRNALAGLGLLSILSGNDEIAEWYLQESEELLVELGVPNLIADILKIISNSNLRSKWDHYRGLRNQQELIMMAEIASQCYGDVLEIGCASGDLSLFIASHGANLYGVDTNPIAVDLARHKAAKLGFDTCRFQTGNGYQLQFDDHIFDTVVVADVLELVEEPKRIINEAYRVCKPGGTVLISVPNGYAIPDSSHFNIFTKKILNNLVQFSTGCSLQWNSSVPKQWILGALIKPTEVVQGSPSEISALFLPQPYKIPENDQLVSVIIPTYNRSDYIAKAVQSVFNQTHKNIEVIVVDDGSTTPPKEALAPYLDRINYIYKENGGKSSALNEAIKQVNGDFIWVFDDDDIALPLKLELQLKRFHTNPELDMIHTNSIDFNTADGQVVRVHDPSPFAEQLDFKMLMRGCFVHGPTVLFRRGCLEKLEGWDNELVRAQDYDFWLRMARSYRMDYLPVPTVRYRIHSGERGSAENRVSFNEIYSKTLNYERLIFRKLYYSIPIQEIYKENFENENITLMLEAFIERALVYSARGLLQEAKQDLVIAKNNALSFGNPNFGRETIENIQKLAQLATQNNWDDHELVSSIFELIQLINQIDE